MAQCTATFEAGTNGNTIATTDTGSTTAFDVVSIGTSCTNKYDNTHKYGALAAKLASAGTSAATYLEWSTALGTQSGTHYGRLYIYATANPGAGTYLVRGRNSGSVGYSIWLGSNGKILLLDKDNVTRGTFTTAITLNQWVRVEWKVIQGTSGTLEAKLFNSPDSSTADETQTAASFNYLSSTNEVLIGLISNSTNYAIWLDNLVVGAASYPGPASTAPANTVAPAVTGTTRVGSTLSTTNGTWTDDGSPAFTYQWQRDNLGDLSYVNISSATSGTYVLVGSDALCNVRCRVTDTDTGGATTASSNAVGPISSINFDAASSSGYEAALSSYSWSHTCSSGSNRVLLVGVSIFAAGTVTGITYNGVALTLARAKANGLYRSELWYLIAPASGAHTVAVTLSTSLTSIGSAASYTGAHQTTPISVLNDAAGTGNPASVSVTTPTNYDWVVDLISTSDGSISVGGSQTSRANNNGALGSGAISDIGPVTPAGVQAMSWTGIGVADTWAYIAAGIDDAADPPVYLEPAQDAVIQICANGSDDGVTEVFSSGLRKLLLLGVG